MRRLLLAALVIGASAAASRADVTILENVRVFGYVPDSLSSPVNVLVRGSVIARISPDPIPTDRSATTMLIDRGGQTLMPG